MSAQTMVLEHRNQLMQLRRLADADLAALTSVTAGLSVAEARETVIEVLPELVGPYITASGELAATMFEDIRAEASRRGTFYAESAAFVPSSQRVSEAARWSVGAAANDAAGATVVSRLSGAVGEWIVGSSMDTIALNSQRELVGYQRMPRANACAFCQMLASQANLYESQRSATEVVGVGSDRTGYDENGKRLSGGIGGGIKPRGKRRVGEKFHNACHCVAVPVYMGTEMGALASSVQERYEKRYKAAIEAAGTSRRRDVLAAWRRLDEIK